MNHQKAKKKNNSIFSHLKNFLPYFFLFLLPTQLGKHFFFSFSYLNGVRVDYLAPTLYLIDIIFFLIFIFNFSLFFSFLRQKKLMFLFLILGLNLLFSLSKPIAFYSILKFFQFIFIFYFFYQTKVNDYLFLISFLSITTLEVFLAFYQLKFGKSYDGFFYFLGERHLNLSTPAIAKTSFFGQELLRPYATFSHPNSLAGFYLLFYVFLLTDKNFDRYFWLKNILLFLSSLLILFSFSKVTIILFLIINLAFYFPKIRLCWLCFLAKIITFFSIFFIFLSAKGDLLSLEKRKELILQSLNIIKNYPLFGVGLGNYLLGQKNFSSSFPLFFNQPVHNIFLLLMAELGLPFFTFLLFFLIDFFKKNSKKIPLTTYYLLLTTILTGFFDHYWLTLKQNFLLLAVVFGISLKRS